MSHSTQQKAKKPAAPKAKITFRHNVLPILLGFMVFGSMLALLNAQWIIAQAEYRFVPKVYASNNLTDYASTVPNKSSALSIPGIQVDAPVITDVPDLTEWKVQLALRRGVVHVAHTALPGQNGNIVIVGHSSGQIWAPGSYKFVFTLLNKMKTNDLIIFDYQGTRYIYRMTGSEIIDPTNFAVLNQTKDPELTLVTCTPVGTSKYRLVIHARQVSPNPASVIAAAVKPTASIDINKLPQ